MFDRRFIANAIGRSAESSADRRNFLRAAGITGLGVGGALLTTGATATAATAAVGSTGPSDGAILNFALNLEYLEAEFYLRAVTGVGLPDSQTTGTGTRGNVTGGRQVTFQTPSIKKYAVEIAADEKAHVAFLRSALGSTAVSRPAINLDASFTAAARAAGLVGPNAQFDVYANEVNFLFGAFIFEDVGVTAYKGAAPLISSATYLDAAAGLLSVEAYHAGIIRTTLYALGVATPSVYTSIQAISNARDSLDGATELDQGIGTSATANLTPTDRNGLTYSRTPGQVLNIAFLNPAPVTSGGFFPAGVNGTLNTSAG